MQFSKLRLLGFKSFVDPVELDILSGLTGIVGPNGCGKSNLLEALRWVMGENRPSSMRSGAMDDVIFAGAGTRAAKNFAEVLIGLNNVNQGPIRLDNENGSVEVVRRVTRDIGSSYRLNGKDVRAKDISILFADNSTGSHSPSLVRQGQITELINANPKSRRRLLEEAAGISGLYQRRHEAELKLKSSENNMTRLQDVIESIENQIRALKKQAKQASKYKELAKDIRINESFLFCKKWFELETKMLVETNSLAEKTKLSASVEFQLISLSKKREAMEEELPNLRNKETKVSSAFQRLIVEKEGIEKEQRRAASSIIELKVRAEEIGKDFKRQNNLIVDANEVIGRVRWETAQLERLFHNHEKSTDIARDEASLTAQKLVDDELKLDQESEDFAKLSVRFKDIENQIDKAKQELETTLNDLNYSEEHTSTLDLALKEKQKELSNAKLAFQKYEKEVRDAENSLGGIEKIRADAIKDELQKRVDFSTLEGRLVALQSEQTALKGLVTVEAEKKNSILDEISIVKGYEMALGAALEDDAKAPIIFTNDITGWFELPDMDETYEFPDGVIPISEKVTAPLVLKKLLLNIGMVDSLDGPRLQKFLKPGQKLVSKDGSLWRWDGYCCIGEDSRSEATVRLQQQNRLTELLSEIESVSNKVELSKINLNSAQAKSAEAEEAGNSARSIRSRSDEKQSEASRLVSKIEAELSILNSKLQSLSENSLSKQKDKERLNSEILELTVIFESLGDLGLQKHRLEEQRSVVEQSRELMVEKRTLFDRVRRDADIRIKRMKELDLDLKNWEKRLLLANESKIELQERKTIVDRELEEAVLQPKILQKRKKSLTELIEAAEKKKVEAQEDLSKKESSLKLCVNEERDLARKLAALREDVARTAALKENAELNLTELRRNIEEKTSSDPESLINSLDVTLENLPDASQIEHKLLSLKNNRDALGAVNLRAAEDSEELTEEWENLSSEKMDLEVAIKKLRTAIVTLNSEGRSRLLEAFRNVNKNFGELFKSLFGGGNAKLTFIEGDDPLDAGLEIICQPPGKKLTTLSLLSGGEQTLTALALIFAVFKANPSPICVLDEVDAPLDDANVERFCGLLDEMTKTTQTRFMIITHHPLTMSRMDRLYGVTMVERGVSQLVSVDLEKAEQLLDV